MQKSEWDGTVLPTMWDTARTHAKGMVIAHLQGRGEAPHWWVDMSIETRRQVVLHLCAVGSVSADLHQRVRNIGGFHAQAATRKAQAAKSSYVTFQESTPFSNAARLAAREMANAYRDRHPELVAMWQRAGMLYPKPNGGKRILPSVYTKLRDTWLRGNGVYQEPAKMNQGHLKNTVALLNESHMNLVDRMCELIGKMHGHLHNRPDLQAKIVDLFHDFEALQVDEIYPIVELIASHIELTADDVDFDPRLLDNWNDSDF